MTIQRFKIDLEGYLVPCEIGPAVLYTDHEARLAEDAKVRAALWVALNSLTLNGAGIWKAFEPEIREVVGRANYSAVSESFDKAALALAAAKEIK